MRSESGSTATRLGSSRTCHRTGQKPATVSLRLPNGAVNRRSSCPDRRPELELKFNRNCHYRLRYRLRPDRQHTPRRPRRQWPAEFSEFGACSADGRGHSCRPRECQGSKRHLSRPIASTRLLPLPARDMKSNSVGSSLLPRGTKGPRFCPVWLRTAAASAGSPPKAANNSGHLSPTVRETESIASTLPINVRFNLASPVKVASSASISVSKDCNRDVRATPRSQPLSRTNEPEGRVLAGPLGVVEVFITRQATVGGLPQQISERKLGIPSPARVGRMLLDQFSEPESLVEFPHEDQTAVRGDARTLEIDLEGDVETDHFLFHPWGLDLRSVLVALTHA